MSTNKSNKEASEQNSIPQSTAETNSQSDVESTSADNGAPSTEQQQSIMNLFRNALNPNGENPQVDEYLTSTFGYLQNVFNKMQTAEDKDATAEEIAQDLTDRFDKWISERENKKKDSDKKEESDKQEESEKEGTEPLKIEEVD
ncbi:DEHA2F07106p [Debaryomyces hansenii CBS767]|uniref:DEHA2F07106p n=1 Tax=Debaryomyces hansenii (strain ATCC 36239 / CBS 767 / BCRC 21394 / JCM 1990 / NBRC 0083 / IGC 2968) TaxID=284592 RepID=B5RUB0_DEBHA|nr:DEHA2F07106p [Debaryomyces hansenii CBS767]CAR66288.1 DEHA2F07106p [Debaryomyces hansenii CBS767]|eukprot:XP_002770761.1 DEHA2F07106p [Debaryomyces hansenii CBS767]